LQRHLHLRKSRLPPFRKLCSLYFLALLGLICGR
jgi:hypothetical protein